MPDFSLQMLPFLLVSFKQSILRIRALTVCKERFVFFSIENVSKSSQKVDHYIDDFGMARKGKSGMATNLHSSKTYWAGYFWFWFPHHDHDLVRLCQLNLLLVGNESQLLTWRLSLYRSSENILYHLKGEHVPKSTEQFLCASCFFFISSKWTKVSAWSFVEKEHVSFARLACLYVLVCVVVLPNENFECEHRRRPSGSSDVFSSAMSQWNLG